MSSRKSIFGTFGFVAASRVVGIVRELLIAALFGFSSSTDLFYQLTAMPTYVTTFTNGPLTTALASSANRSGAPEPAAYMPGMMRNLIRYSALAASFLWLFAVVIGYRHHRLGDVTISASIVAPAVILITILGLGGAFFNSRGHFLRAQSLLFSSNLSFVVFLLAGWVLRKHGVSLVLCAAYLLAALVGAWLSRNSMRADIGSIPVNPGRLPGFVHSLSYASMETTGYIVTQAIVLLCAAKAGTGTTSAANLAQRIALSIQGLIVIPAANMLMVKMARARQAQLQLFIISILTTAIGLALFGGSFMLGLKPLLHLLTHFSHKTQSSGALLASLIPSYLVWLVALGTNAMASQLLFAMGKGKLFTSVTLSSYFLANATRLFMFYKTGFASSIVWGGVVELVIVSGLVVWVATTMRSKKKETPQSTEVVAREHLV